MAPKNQPWPLKEAQQLLDHVDKLGLPSDAPVLLETGYGPSGLPHIGTFAEVARTTFVRRGFRRLSGRPTKLIAYSDDTDGLRKVPLNLPNPELVEPHLGKPLCDIPDPFGVDESFSAHMNRRLREFLDSFGFEYEFQSATECYTSCQFDAALLQVLKNYDAVINVILPTLGPERRATYSPFLPVCPRTGVVLQEPILERDVDKGTIVYKDPETGELMETPVTGGHCKLQWKADWAMRWFVLGVDYEMAGKDLIDSVRQSSKITRATKSHC